MVCRVRRKRFLEPRVDCDLPRQTKCNREKKIRATDATAIDSATNSSSNRAATAIGERSANAATENGSVDESGESGQESNRHAPNLHLVDYTRESNDDERLENHDTDAQGAAKVHGCTEEDDDIDIRPFVEDNSKRILPNTNFTVAQAVLLILACSINLGLS